MPVYDVLSYAPDAANSFSNHSIYLFARDARDRLTPNETQRTTLIVAACYIVAIAILWHIPYLTLILYPFKLLTVGFHEMSHALAGVLTCAHIHSIEIDPDEGGATHMSGGISWITLPAGYLGSSFIGAALIVCGFDTNASKVACLVLAGFFLFFLWWARREVLTWILIFLMAGLIVLFWFVAGGVALRYFILFIGVMSCMYVLWDVVDDTIARKVNGSDASSFAEICGCCPSQGLLSCSLRAVPYADFYNRLVWGVIWLLVAAGFFAAAIIIGIVAFKQSAAQQASDSQHFLPVPGSHSATLGLDWSPLLMVFSTVCTTLVMLNSL
ncbi:peptidase M50B-like-domain-containing protein [Irpex rosettiformis]|uniref:Peptidase M50B-like-domain-containing protein n=1 Tax=Irpex rosettiformis TaxID=378272 RepID=A0ACB8UJB8_9APHY|nr:peptidase M50B-like-domain-containing protein [Irpex rosettiformis]